MSKVRGQGLLIRLAESFAARLRERTQALRPGEAIGLQLPGRDAPKAVKDVGVTLRGSDQIELRLRWLDGSEETLCYGPQEFTPTLHRLALAEAAAPESQLPLPDPDPQRSAEPTLPRGWSPAVERLLLENLIGHLSGLMALEAMALSERASRSADPAGLIAREHQEAQAVLAAATMVVPRLDAAGIRAAAERGLARCFGAVQLHERPLS